MRAVMTLFQFSPFLLGGRARFGSCTQGNVCVRACVRACVRERVRACVRERVRACVRECVCVCVVEIGTWDVSRATAECPEQG